jgi:hypothetical protein
LRAASIAEGAPELDTVSSSGTAFLRRGGREGLVPRFPVIAVVHSFMVHGSDGSSRDEVLGPPLCRIYERSAVRPLPPKAPPPPSLGVFARRASKIFGWSVLGLGRPSPLFDDRTNAPRAAPRVLTPNERADLERRSVSFTR